MHGTSHAAGLMCGCLPLQATSVAHPVLAGDELISIGFREDEGKVDATTSDDECREIIIMQRNLPA